MPRKQRTRPAARAAHFRKLEALYAEQGSAVPFCHGAKFPLDRYATCPEVFQPRGAEAAPEIEENVRTLLHLLKSDDEIARTGFDPLLVFPIAGRYYILDGHCRLEAYLRAETPACSCKVFQGTFRAAVREALRCNSGVKLTFTQKARSEAAWQAVCDNFQLAEDSPDRQSLRDLASVTSVSKSTLSNMQKVLSEGIPGRPLYDTAWMMDQPWGLVWSLYLHPDTGKGEWEQDQRTDHLGGIFRKQTRKLVSRHPEDFAPAVLKGYGPSLASRLPLSPSPDGPEELSEASGGSGSALIVTFGGGGLGGVKTRLADRLTTPVSGSTLSPIPWEPLQCNELLAITRVSRIDDQYVRRRPSQRRCLMRSHRWISAPTRSGIALLVGLVVSGALAVAVAYAATQATKLDSSIFAYDGHDFVRTSTTLITADGKPALNTKLDHKSPAYEALLHKRSYSGETTLFGKKYDANYAPLMGADGKVTGALFVAVPK